ncbi:MAG: nucleoside permease [Bacteroidales bacterium]|uniref:nucleoside permease n=1 Tax=Porphyromonas sp. TaxID=1924944 RepID=UPI0029719F6F|nr:nucleoside permease [Porphyromonas sp.]MDD7437836.1 nucleoside permease [Bacteroidales bacterium]MDY3067134.1 nucleoside permease [Porphyromonas sp.]
MTKTGGAGRVKLQLIAMNFLQFAIWGAWLISLGAYLGGTLQFSGIQIGSFFATMGIAALFMPTLMGIIADKWIPAERLIALCHLFAGVLMVYAAQRVDYIGLYTFVLLSVCFYMPTLGLTNAVAYSKLNEAKLDSVKHFPPIRVFGTIGFIVAMLVIDWSGVKMTNIQLYISAGLSFVLALYMLTFKPTPIVKKEEKSDITLIEKLGLQAFALFKERRMAVFFIFSMLLGICLQITNGYANDYLTNYFGKMPEYADSFGVKYSGTLISLSQISEAVCILLIPFFLRKYGIKVVMLISLFAWVLRFGFLGFGNPGDGVVLLIFSMLVYGVAFDFFNISGSLYVDQNTDVSIRSSAQGVFLMMTNGFGSFIGSYVAGWVVDKWGYPYSWYIFAAYALTITIAFYFLFQDKPKDKIAYGHA